MGLSPHIRGNPALALAQGRARGSIPAHTGEPDKCRKKMGSGGVYPRTYGGTVSQSPIRRTIAGLSPHIRGNHDHFQVLDYFIGSIPAHTGEPLRKWK